MLHGTKDFSPWPTIVILALRLALAVTAAVLLILTDPTVRADIGPAATTLLKAAAGIVGEAACDRDPGV